MNIDVSIIVPTYNRPKQLKRCLEAILEQDFDGNWEIIIVDDGSKEDLRPIIDGLNSSDRIKYYKQKNSGPACARNKGAQMSKGRFLAFTDDDCAPKSNWLSVLMKNAKKGMLLGGKTINHFKKNIYSETSQILIDYLYRSLKETTFYFFTTNNFLIGRQAFFETNGFDESFPTSAGEDMEFCVRCNHLGYTLNYVKDANVMHFHKLSFKTFCKLHYKYGRASVIFRQKLGKMKIKKIKNPFHFHRKLLAFPFELNSLSFSKKIQLFTLLLLSQIAHRLGFISNSKNLIQ